jgi:hypothetical protein
MPAHLAQFMGKDGVLAQSPSLNNGLFRSPSRQEMFAPEAPVSSALRRLHQNSVTISGPVNGLVTIDQSGGNCGPTPTETPAPAADDQVSPPTAPSDPEPQTVTVGYGRKLLQTPAPVPGLAPAAASVLAPALAAAAAPAPGPEMGPSKVASHAEAPAEHRPTHENSSETIVRHTTVVIVSRPKVVVTTPSRPHSGKGRRLQNATAVHQPFIRG